MSAEHRVQALLAHFMPNANPMQLGAVACASNDHQSTSTPTAADTKAQLAFQAPLTADIAFLSEKLLSLIAACDGEDVAATVRHLVRSSQSYRESGGEDQMRELQARVSALMRSPPEGSALISLKVVQVARAFHEVSRVRTGRDIAARLCASALLRRSLRSLLPVPAAVPRQRR